jgi:hypothetical protein
MEHLMHFQLCSNVFLCPITVVQMPAFFSWKLCLCQLFAGKKAYISLEQYSLVEDVTIQIL